MTNVKQLKNKYKCDTIIMICEKNYNKLFARK